MKRHHTLLLVLILCVSMLAVACGSEQGDSSLSSDDSSADTYEKLKIKMSYTMSDAAIDGMVASYMKEELSKRSNGAITLECFGNATLASGNMARQVEMLIAGSGFDMAILGEQLFAAQDPKLNVTNLPFAFESYEEAYQYADSTGGEWSAKALEDLGVKRLGTFSNGIFQLSNNKKAITSVDGLKGMKIRGYGELNIRMTSAFGCDAVSINFSELYSALQMGTVDGQTNGYVTMANASLQEVQPYITELNASWVPFDIVYNLKAWDSLPANTRALIQEVALEAAQYGRKHMDESEAKIKQDFIDAGVEITVLTPEQKQTFVDAVQPVIDEYIEICGEEACRAWGIID